MSHVEGVNILVLMLIVATIGLLCVILDIGYYLTLDGVMLLWIWTTGLIFLGLNKKIYLVGK